MLGTCATPACGCAGAKTAAAPAALPILPLHNVTFHLVIHCGVRVKIQIGTLAASEGTASDATEAPASVRYSWGRVEDTWGRDLRTISFERCVVRGAFIRLQFMVDAEHEDMLACPPADPDAQMEIPPFAMAYFIGIEAVAARLQAEAAKAQAEAARIEALRVTERTWKRIQLQSFSVDGVEHLNALQLAHSELDFCNIPKTAEVVIGPIRSPIAI